MSVLVSTEAVVLNTSDFSNTSKIVVLYTQKLGKISTIIKGGRDKNSKIGRTADILNLITTVLYNKTTREVQLLTQAELVAFFRNIREDYHTLLYAHAAIELIQSLVREHEENQRLFAGLRRILFKFDARSEPPSITFLRFMIFFIEISGYEISTDRCSHCGEELPGGVGKGFNNINGIVCANCSSKIPLTTPLSEELFNALYCLKTGGQKPILSSGDDFKILRLLENFLRFHFQDFTGLKSLKGIKN